MPIFTTDKQTYLKMELISWAKDIVLVVIVNVGFWYFAPVHKNTGVIAMATLLVHKLIQTFTQYHVDVIQINKETGKMNVRLRSLMTGYDYKSYPLQEVSSERKGETSWLNFHQTKVTLRIHLPKNAKLQITDRYGFTNDTLTLIDEALKIQ